jgi:hypothetical protein
VQIPSIWEHIFFDPSSFNLSLLCFCRLADAMQPLSSVFPIPSSKLTPYRCVIIMRLVILCLFFHYRITHPVDSAFGLWLTSVICEIWFAVSWVLDQFPKWSPIDRITYIDELSARYTSMIHIRKAVDVKDPNYNVLKSV